MPAAIGVPAGVLRRALAHPLCWTLALLASIALLIASAVPPVHQAAIDRAAIRAEQGRAWLAPVPQPRSRLYRVWGADVGRAASAALLLLEDGVPQALGDASHESIRTVGGGRYSHWGNDLYFSTADGSDPRSSGREYSVRVPARMRDRWLVLAVLLAAGATIGMAVWVRQRPQASSTVRRTSALAAGAATVLLVLQAATLWVPLAREQTASLAPSPDRPVAIELDAGALHRLLRVRSGSVEVRVAGQALAALPAGDAGDSGLRVAGGMVVMPVPAAATVVIGSDWRVAPRVLAATAVLLLLALLWTAIASRTSSPRGAVALLAWADPRAWRERWAVAFALTGGLASAALLWAFWRTGASGHLGAAALLPVSDALGYFQCALLAGEPSARAAAGGALADPAHYAMQAEWCSRRTAWPLSLLSLLWLSGWRAGLALLLQAILIGLALGLAVRAAWQAFGAAAAAALAAVGLLFAAAWATGTFMTEVYGMAAGLCGAALLLRHAVQRDPVALAAGLALLSLALTARAGALFVLPLLLVWGYLGLCPPGRWRAPAAAALVIGALLVGPALQWLGALHYMGEVTNTGGNFAASLYGLSTGSRDWAQAYRDFAPLFAARPESEVFAHIQQRAIENIVSQPAVFMESLRVAGTGFLRQPFALTDGLAASSVPALFMWLGVVYALMRVRERAFSLLLVVFAGESLAAPLIVDSGGARVFAATFWVRPLLAGVGLLALVSLVSRLQGRPAPQAAASVQSPPWSAHALAALLLAIAVLPLLAPAGTLRPSTTPVSAPCRAGETPLALRPGRESMAVTIGAPWQAPLQGALVVGPDRVEQHSAWRGSWWAGNVGPLPTGRSLLVAVDAHTASRGRVFALFVDAPLQPDADGVLRLCVGASTGRPLGDLGLHPAAPPP